MRKEFIYWNAEFERLYLKEKESWDKAKIDTKFSKEGLEEFYKQKRDRKIELNNMGNTFCELD